ncbi:hypothetical protein GCM10011587_03200 [Pyruvatibacter mobilis]|nr:hypothetical protein GCM10011587_03200 [Pyruvatibacter mobilis]
MRIGRTRFVHLPHRVAAAPRVASFADNPATTTKSAPKDTSSQPRPADPRGPGARVLWREIPNWHNIPSDPQAALCSGTRAYARAQTLNEGLHSTSPSAVPGRLADKTA